MKVKYLNEDNTYSDCTLPVFIKAISGVATMPEMGILIDDNIDMLYACSYSYFSSPADAGKLTLISYIDGVTYSKVTPLELINTLCALA
jgi:hypothetical protein